MGLGEYASTYWLCSSTPIRAAISGRRFTSETLPELERLLGELSVLTTSLRRLSEQTERDPRGLIFGRKPVPEGPGEQGVGP